MASFTGQLNTNEIFAALYNMIISQQVFSDNIAGGAGIADKARVDGSLYGDTKLYYSTDCLKSYAWNADSEAANLLTLYRPDAPEVQAIELDIFRQIPLTVDNYLSKRAWKDEGAFSSFTAVMMGWMGDTKKVYDFSTYSAFFGTDETNSNDQSVTISTASLTSTGEELDRQTAGLIAESIKNIIDSLTIKPNRINDYGHLRKWDVSQIKIVWNNAWVNKIEKRDLPSLFHKDGLFDKMSEVMDASYFGNINAAATAGDGSTIYSLVEQEIGSNHYFAGDLIVSGDTAPAGTSYTVDATIACKIFVEYPPFMSAFEVGTSFFNPKSLTETHYSTWGHNTLEHLENYPFITVRVS